MHDHFLYSSCFHSSILPSFLYQQMTTLNTLPLSISSQRKRCPCSFQLSRGGKAGAAEAAPVRDESVILKPQCASTFTEWAGFFNLWWRIFIYFFVCLFIYWRIVDLQCFRCTAKWFSYIYIHIYVYIFFFRFFSIIGYLSDLLKCRLQGPRDGFAGSGANPRSLHLHTHPCDPYAGGNWIWESLSKVILSLRWWNCLNFCPVKYQRQEQLDITNYLKKKKKNQWTFKPSKTEWGEYGNDKNCEFLNSYSSTYMGSNFLAKMKDIWQKCTNG